MCSSRFWSPAAETRYLIHDVAFVAGHTSVLTVDFHKFSMVSMLVLSNSRSTAEMCNCEPYSLSQHIPSHDRAVGYRTASYISANFQTGRNNYEARTSVLPKARRHSELTE
ncbi:hypothetical protein X801_00865, partial [Opisthorchis viverrini]